MPIGSSAELLAAHHGMLIDGLTAVFGALDADMARHLLPQVEWIELGGGDDLFHQNDTDASLFFVVSGRLRVTSIDGSGRRHVLGEVARGETVGEMAFFTGEPRTATVTAIRDSVLAHFSNAVFRELLLAYPLVSLNMTRLVIERAMSFNRGPAPMAKPVTIGLLAITRSIDLPAFAQTLARQLQTHGRSTIVHAAQMDAVLGEPGAAQAPRVDFERSRKVTVLLDKIEAQHDFVVLVADPQLSEWSQRCIRHCDQLLLVADADLSPAQHPNEAGLHVPGEQANVQTTLVLLHTTDPRTPTDTRHWLDGRRLSEHFHLRHGLAGDWQRLARVLSRNTVGLVFSGGGARGFAHLGVLRALEQAGISFDMAAGTSIGAVMAAYAAMDLPADEIIAAARAAFRGNPTGDYSLLPLMSLIRGKRLRRTIDSAVVDSRGQHIDIEDLWKSYFCISSNFSAAREAVHTRGPLARSIRASVSIPGALPPVMLDGELHTDGGTFNNFPTDVMHRRGARRIIGVDLLRNRGQRHAYDEVPGMLALLRDRLRGPNRRYRLPSLMSLLLDTSQMVSYARQQEAQSLVDLHFAPGVEGFGLLDWGKFDQIVEAGYRHGMDRLDQLGDAAITAYRAA